MFDRILIKSESRSAERLLSIRDIVDMMFYYGEVHVVVSQFELGQLLQVFGEDVLYELIKTQRLIVHPCDQHIGAVMQNGLCSAGMFRHNYDSIEQLLYIYHRQFIRNSTDNMRFASKFSKILVEYRYPNLVQESIYKDIENDAFLSKATQIFIKQYYPEYRNSDEITLHAESVQTQLEEMYHIEGNLRIDELNTMHHQLGYLGTFSYSTVLLAIGETAQDCYLSSELESDMISNSRWAETYKLRMNKCIESAEKNIDNIECFHQTVAFEIISPGEAFSCGALTPNELLKILDERDSIRFKEWLKTLPMGTPISGEFYNKIRDFKSNKPWVKAVRILSQFLLGLAHPIVGIAVSSIDSYVVEKIINGWNPQLFVENVLRNKKLKQDPHYE